MAVDRETSRTRLRSLADGQLVDEMRANVPEAWHEFEQRFRPLLERYARRTGISREDLADCATIVLEDAALRWAVKGEPLPENVLGYLLRAMNYRRLTLRRDEERRERHTALASVGVGEATVVASLCSAASLRDAAAPTDASSEPANVVDVLALALVRRLTPPERELLERAGDGLPHREIAAMLGISTDAARKRIARLAARSRTLLADVLRELSDEQRIEARRFLRRLDYHDPDPEEGDAATSRRPR